MDTLWACRKLAIKQWVIFVYIVYMSSVFFLFVCLFGQSLVNTLLANQPEHFNDPDASVDQLWLKHLGKRFLPEDKAQADELAMKDRV